jgi:ketosteroid isomerase-like protein
MLKRFTTAKRIAIHMMLLAAMSIPGLASAAEVSDPPKGAQRALSGFLSAFENLDMERFIGAFANDATVFFPTPEPPQRFDGKQAIRAHFEQVFAAIRKSSAASSPPYHHLQPDNLYWQALSSSVVIVTFQLQNSERIARRTVVLAKTRGIWLIVHLHASNVSL